MFTGLSGSGKSSLAFDTIYAEGQRRYVESLSAYARQFLEMMQKPDVDHIDGLSPAISIEQKTTSKNPRSTVGTVTEIYDYLRLLFARVGVPYSPATGLPIESQTVQQMVDRVLTLPEGTRLYLLAPIVRGRKGEYRKELAELQKKGFQRVKVNGAVLRDRRGAQARQEIQARHRRGGGPPGPAEGGRRKSAQGHRHAPRRQLRDGAGAGRRHRHRRVRGQAAARRPSPRPSRGEGQGRGGTTTASGMPLTPALSPQGGREGRRRERDEKEILRNKNETHERITFSARFACPVSGFTIDEIEPRLFSFNAPAGACPKCDGLGTEMRFEADLVVPDHTLSLKQGAVYPWAKTGSTSPYYEQTLEALAKHFKVSMTTPWEKLPKKVQDAILYGTGEEEVDVRLRGRRAQVHQRQAVRGRDRQHRAPLPRDRERLGARGAVALPGCAPVRRLRRLSPQAAGAGGEDRRPAHRPGDGHVDPRRQRLVRRAAEEALQEAERDRHAHPEGDPRAAAVPGRRRASTI